MASDYNSFVNTFYLTCETGEILKIQKALASGRLTAENLDKGLTITTEDMYFNIVTALFNTGARVMDLIVATFLKRLKIE